MTTQTATIVIPTEEKHKNRHLDAFDRLAIRQANAVRELNRMTIRKKGKKLLKRIITI